MGMIRNALDRIAIRADVPEPSQMPARLVPPSRSNSSVTLKSSIGLVPVYRSLQVLSVMIGQLDWRVRRRGAWLVDTPALVAQPDAFLSRSRFIKRTVVSLAGTGNAYWLKIRGSEGLVISYRVLNPLAIRREYDDRNRPFWIYAEQVGHTSVERRYSVDDIRHLKLLEIPGFDLGVGPIEACRIALGGHADVRDYGSTWFHDSGTPNGALKTDQQLTPSQANQLRDEFIKRVDGHGVAVLGYGTDYQPFYLKPSDALWLEAQQFGATDTARMFGLPAPYLDAPVDGDSQTYTNQEQIDTKLIRTTLMGYVNEIEDALTADLPRGQQAVGIVGSLNRSDNFTRAKINALYLQNKVLTARQVAEDEGYTYEGADVNA